MVGVVVVVVVVVVLTETEVSWSQNTGIYRQMLMPLYFLHF
jgi:hypothetical protein